MLRRLATVLLVTIILGSVALAATGAVSGQAPSNQTPVSCNPDPPPPDADLPVKWTEKNTMTFNHRDLTANRNRHYVLEVDDGGFFQVIFACTAPAFFTYSITGDPEAKPGSSNGQTLAESVNVTGPLVHRGVTMRHDPRFLKYRVSAKLREGFAPPKTGNGGDVDLVVYDSKTSGGKSAGELAGLKSGGQTIGSNELLPSTLLYSVEFDVWVRTGPEWKLGVIGGVALSSLVNERFYIKPGAEGKTTFEKAPDVANDQRAADVIALANAYYSKTFMRFVNLGAAFGIGTSGTSPRYFLGPSVVLGTHFVIAGGWALGNVAKAPIGQVISEAPINGANTLNTLSSRFASQSFLGIGFTWIDRRDQFGAAFASSASASGNVGSCLTSVVPSEITFDATGKANGDVSVEAGDDCSWIATFQNGAGTGFEITKNSSGKGKATITLKGAAASTDVRSNVLNIIGPAGSKAKSVKLSQAAVK